MLPGSDVSAWKDVVVTRDGSAWRMWACEHLLDQGDDEADRMRSVYVTSDDGLSWTMRAGRARADREHLGRRGARITSACESDGKWIASYDGRASAAENWFERTGFAVGATPDDFVPGRRTVRPGRPDAAVRDHRPAGDGLRLYFEAERADGANDLRTVLVPCRIDPALSRAGMPPAARGLHSAAAGHTTRCRRSSHGRHAGFAPWPDHATTHRRSTPLIEREELELTETARPPPSRTSP